MHQVTHGVENDRHVFGAFKQNLHQNGELLSSEPCDMATFTAGELNHFLALRLAVP